ncbi:DUF4233 domain-containing protein [Nocardiopsis composta]|uniref:DUF4233 domain-containing protein n=1 Tax=Nocardiopsis composta TaxID=157465 RepID=A0A7W8QSG2_9ACTN|nr:DUF4233 domain-containing protein [Nocardiopsis composta]MBB5435299.1 hypothetical protein [Nocardiopsis composta]
MRTICAVVLAFEVIVIGLAVPVAINLAGFSPAVAGGVWGGLAAAALVLAGLQRFRWAHYAAWVLQAAFVASGFLVPGLALLGIVFAGLWVAGVVLGRRTDAMKAAADDAAGPQAA